MLSYVFPPYLELLYSESRTLARMLRQIRPDGSGLRKLYDSHGGLAAHPHFSPDSQRIVFTCDCSGAARLRRRP